ncbi:hypothetical protein EV130_112240 [Rhizobium azibense]|uniref:Uncharacterized protein n=1 Tax=Rhizobium azibense TaxID=1136135 RepID=A0A4R3QGI7_9HYPH|nr:hypothetical protein EV130_112240 [Rhizobium azibense]
MLEIHDGVTDAIANAQVIYSGQIALSPRQRSFRVTTDDPAMVFEVYFGSSSSKESAASEAVALNTFDLQPVAKSAGAIFTLPVFGNDTLGAVVAGSNK